LTSAAVSLVHLNGVQSAEGVRELAKGVFLLEQIPQLARLIIGNSSAGEKGAGEAKKDYLQRRFKKAEPSEMHGGEVGRWHVLGAVPDKNLSSNTPGAVARRGILSRVLEGVGQFSYFTSSGFVAERKVGRKPTLGLHEHSNTTK